MGGVLVKFLKDANGTVMAKIHEDIDGRVVDVVTYNNAKMQRWKIVEERPDYGVWEKV